MLNPKKKRKGDSPPPDHEHEHEHEHEPERLHSQTPSLQVRDDSSHPVWHCTMQSRDPVSAILEMSWLCSVSVVLPCYLQ